MESAKDELLGKIYSYLRELSELGFNYELTNGQKGDARRKTTMRQRVRRAAPCKVCGFQTNKPHDARAHRWQAKKAPFTKRELEKKGLVRIKG